jgi:hypothetical protein
LEEKRITTNITWCHTMFLRCLLAAKMYAIDCGRIAYPLQRRENNIDLFFIV